MILRAIGQFKSCFPHRPEVVVNQQLPVFFTFKTAKIFQKPLTTVNLIVHALFRHGYTLENVAAEELIGESRKDYMMRNEKSLRSKQIYSDMPW